MFQIQTVVVIFPWNIREEYRLRVAENRVLGTFGAKRDKM
jgi:hypothetical protein